MGVRFALICAAVCAFAAPACARVVDEARVGVAAHNVHFRSDSPDSSGQSDETGPDLELEIVSSQLRGVFGAPRPYAMLSANLAGDTSYAAAGLLWRWRFARRWTFEPSFGLAIHNGATHNPYPPGDPRAEEYAREHQLLGTRALFRETLAVDRELDARQSLGLSIAHLSNGGTVFGHSDNEGLNEVALRYTIRR
jgi:hypothetical protein